MDLAGKEALEKMLTSYEGTVLFVSHDRYFINQVATGILEFGESDVQFYGMNYAQYLEEIKRQTPGRETGNAGGAVRKPADVPTLDDVFDKKKYYNPGKILSRLKRQLEKYEEQLAESESRMSELQLEMMDPELSANYEQLMELQTKIDEENQAQESLLERMMETELELEGRSMVNIISIAQELGYINIPENTLIDVEQMKNYTGEQLVLITTGSQGESMAALSRMAAHLHKKISILPGDTVIFSSHPIPGNEKAVSNVINELSAQGANVVFQDVHVSGHACQEEIKLIYSLVKPKYAIPVHGEYRHLKAHAEVAQSLGIPKENIFLMYSGDVMELDEDGAAVTGKVHTGAIMVDGLGVGDVGNIVLRDRQHLSEDGIMVVVLTLEKRTNQLLAGPDIVSRGFVYVRESEDLMGEAREVVEEALDGCLSKNISDWGKIKSTIKDALGDYVWKKTKRRPMILPIIMEA